VLTSLIPDDGSAVGTFFAYTEQFFWFCKMVALWFFPGRQKKKEKEVKTMPVRFFP